MHRIIPIIRLPSNLDKVRDSNLQNAMLLLFNMHFIIYNHLKLEVHATFNFKWNMPQKTLVLTSVKVQMTIVACLRVEKDLLYTDTCMCQVFSLSVLVAQFFNWNASCKNTPMYNIFNPTVNCSTFIGVQKTQKNNSHLKMGKFITSGQEPVLL